MLCIQYKIYDHIPTQCTFIIINDNEDIMLFIVITQIIVMYKSLVYSFILLDDFTQVIVDFILN